MHRKGQEMWLRACLNGPRPPGSHPAVPMTPSTLAREGRRAIDAGAVALHIHPRAVNGKETLEPEQIAAALIAVRESCPGIPLEVSTAAWIEQDVARRLACVRSWIELPDSAGVNFGEAGAVELATTLLARGIGVEAGIFSAEDAQRLIAAGLAQLICHRKTGQVDVLESSQQEDHDEGQSVFGRTDCSNLAGG